MQKYQGEIILFLVTLLAAFGWFASKFAIAELPSAGFLAIRFCVAAALFLPFSYRAVRHLNGQQWRYALTVGGAFSANIFLWIQAITHSQYFGEGAFLMSLSLLIAPLLSWLLFRHRPIPMFWISLALAIFGVYALNAGKPLAQFSWATLLYAASALMGALFFVFNNQYAKHVPTLALATVQLACAGVVCGAYSLIFETWQNAVSAQTWIWVTISILLITNFRYFLQTWGQKLCPIGNAAMMMILEPVWTVVLSVAILNEPVTWQKILGGGLILSALVVYRLPLKMVGK